MSSSNALAKQRRAGVAPPPPQQQQLRQPQQQQQSQGPNVNTPGLTLPQVISLVDSRLITLEKFMKETKESASTTNSSSSSSSSEQNVVAAPPADFVDEIQNRFDMLASEILDLKDIVLKLQAYTMDVNKTLLEERIHILSDLGEETTPRQQSVQTQSETQEQPSST